jgi:hypothetical protein
MLSIVMQYIEAAKQETQQGQQPKTSGTDISAAIADEVADIKSGNGQPLTWHRTNITGLLYLALDASAGKSGTSALRQRANNICESCHGLLMPTQHEFESEQF